MFLHLNIFPSFISRYWCNFTIPKIHGMTIQKGLDPIPSLHRGVLRFIGLLDALGCQMSSKPIRGRQDQHWQDWSVGIHSIFFFKVKLALARFWSKNDDKPLRNYSYRSPKKTIRSRSLGFLSTVPSLWDWVWVLRGYLQNYEHKNKNVNVIL